MRYDQNYKVLLIPYLTSGGELVFKNEGNLILIGLIGVLMFLYHWCDN